MKVAQVPKRRTAQIRREMEVHLTKWKQSGRKTARYTCPDCKQRIETIRPRKRDTGTQGYWDGLKTCTACGSIRMVRVYPNGRTEID